MRILLTGAKGFIGRYTVPTILHEGHFLLEYGREGAAGASSEKHKAVLGELTDIPRLVQVIKDYQIDCIIHLAGQSHPPTSIELPLMTVESNVMGTMGILESARMCGIKRVVLCSSEDVYGDAQGPSLNSESNLKPRTPYGASKVACELIAASYNVQYKMECISLRIGEVFGPGRVTSEVIQDFVNVRKSKEITKLAVSGLKKIPLVYVEDVASALLCAAVCDFPETRAIYNIVTEMPTLETVKQVFTEMDGYCNVTFSEDIPYEEQAVMEIRDLKEAIGYAPSVYLKEGILKYVQNEGRACTS